MNKTIELFLKEIPNLHTWDNGATWNTGGFQESHLRLLLDFLSEALSGGGSTTLETGAGNTTILFLLLEPKKHIAIAPDNDLFLRIKEYCQTSTISTDALECIVEGSESTLPRLVSEQNENLDLLDFALIDGCHNFPMVFIDFFYINKLLKIGGYLMVDDLQLHSVKELYRMLSMQPGWEKVLDLGKAAVFRKVTIGAQDLGDWNGSPYIVEKTNEYTKLENPFLI